MSMSETGQTFRDLTPDIIGIQPFNSRSGYIDVTRYNPETLVVVIRRA